MLGIFAYYSRYGLAMLGALATALSILSAVLYGELPLTGGITGDDVSLLPAER